MSRTGTFSRIQSCLLYCYRRPIYCIVHWCRFTSCTVPGSDWVRTPPGGSTRWVTSTLNTPPPTCSRVHVLVYCDPWLWLAERSGAFSLVGILWSCHGKLSVSAWFGNMDSGSGVLIRGLNNCTRYLAVYVYIQSQGLGIPRLFKYCTVHILICNARIKATVA